MIAAHYQTGVAYEFTFAHGRVKSRRRCREQTDLVFGPGFLDLQCNGYAGIDFNSPETTPEEIATAIRAMRAAGCTHVFPTLVTNTPERLEHLFRNLCAALALDGEIARAVPGFHLEGPFISPVDGARGAHPLASVVPVKVSLWRRLQKAAEGRIRQVTLAPEVRGALPFIRQLREEAVLPAVGHTMASLEQFVAAGKAGALLSTHLGNGCPQQVHRHLNPIIAQLGVDSLSASLITDGIHLPPEAVLAFSRAKKRKRIVVVTDAMSAAGAPPGRYRLADLTLEVGADRVVRFPGSPMFAGSALTMDRAVAGYHRMAQVPWAKAWDAASVRPWKLLSRAIPQLQIPALKENPIFARLTSDSLEVIQPS